MDLALGLEPTRASFRDSLTLSPNIDPYDIFEPKDQRIDEVRIIPGNLIFKDAYDGKCFNQAFTVINCGKNPAFVRILSPSSKAFKMKPIPRGQQLSAGMSITRNVSYTHSSVMALSQATIMIYINEKSITYEIEVHLNAPFVILSPKIIDFGEVDVGSVSKKKCITLFNRGHKVTQFIVDLRRADIALVVQPMNGTIEPSETIEIYLEVLGYKLGAFYKEFWIKTEPLQRVKLAGTFIQPGLVIEHPLSTFKLTLIDFPKTYYGSKITRTLVIKNNSSTPTMFCLVLESGGQFKCIDTGMKTNVDLKCFSMTPIEGRLGAKQEFIMQISFVPKKTKQFEKLNGKYSLVFLRVINVQYRDRVPEDEKVTNYREGENLDQEILESNPTQQDSESSKHLPKINFLQLCLYGEMEEASVKLIPDSFTIPYLKLNETYSYELSINNISKYLPIIFQYNKVACVEVEPKRMILKPKGSVEVTLTIKPSRMGPMHLNITFDLIYEVDHERWNVGKACLSLNFVSSLTCPAVKPKFNWGITPKITNEVGYMVDDVRFCTNIEMPRQAIIDKNSKNFDRNNDDLIAFPNDRPRVLRPWRNKVP